MITFGEFVHHLIEAFGPQGVEQVFHKDAFGLPQGMPMPPHGMVLRYGQHSRDRMHEKGVDKPPVRLPDKFELIECTYVNGKLTKWLVRFPYDQYDDLVVSITPDGFVCTVFVNAWDDPHKTLDKRRYTDPRMLRKAA